jgi:AraC-like DNA-binding protein
MAEYLRLRLRSLPVDTVAGFLDGPRAHNAFLLRSILEPPWCLRVQDEAPLTVVAVVRGTAWITFEGGAASALAPGDVAIVRGPDPYTVADDPATPPGIVIHPGGRCATVDGEPLHEAMDLGVRTWGNSATGSVVLLTGTYETDTAVGRRLLDTLPALTIVSADECDSPVVALLAAEIVSDEPGQAAVLDRLLDLVLVAVLRSALARGMIAVPAWYRASSDPIVGPVLRMMHNEPAMAWTVADLAARIGTSRAALARRFNEQVGEPPIAYLTGWRMALAADLLLDDDATVTAVARQVGYGSPFTFSTAFKRTHGVSPRSYRARRQPKDRDRGLGRAEPTDR